MLLKSYIAFSVLAGIIALIISANLSPIEARVIPRLSHEGSSMQKENGHKVDQSLNYTENVNANLNQVYQVKRNDVGTKQVPMSSSSNVAQSDAVCYGSCPGRGQSYSGRGCKAVYQCG